MREQLVAECLHRSFSATLCTPQSAGRPGLKRPDAVLPRTVSDGRVRPVEMSTFSLPPPQVVGHSTTYKRESVRRHVLFSAPNRLYTSAPLCAACPPILSSPPATPSLVADQQSCSEFLVPGLSGNNLKELRRLVPYLSILK